MLFNALSGFLHKSVKFPVGICGCECGCGCWHGEIVEFPQEGAYGIAVVGHDRRSKVLQRALFDLVLMSLILPVENSSHLII